MWIEPILQKYIAKILSIHFAYCESNKISPFVAELLFLQFDAEVEFPSPINLSYLTGQLIILTHN